MPSNPVKKAGPSPSQWALRDRLMSRGKIAARQFLSEPCLNSRDHADQYPTGISGLRDETNIARIGQLMLFFLESVISGSPAASIMTRKSKPPPVL